MQMREQMIIWILLSKLQNCKEMLLFKRKDWHDVFINSTRFLMVVHKCNKINSSNEVTLMWLQKAGTTTLIVQPPCRCADDKNIPKQLQ